MKTKIDFYYEKIQSQEYTSTRIISLHKFITCDYRSALHYHLISINLQLSYTQAHQKPTYLNAYTIKIRALNRTSKIFNATTASF